MQGGPLTVIRQSPAAVLRVCRIPDKIVRSVLSHGDARLNSIAFAVLIGLALLLLKDQP